MKKIRTVLFGLGTVNRGFLKILIDKKNQLINDYGIEFIITAVVDSSGFAIDENGYDYELLFNLKTLVKKVNSLSGFQHGKTVNELTDLTEADLLIESSPGNIATGEPGLSVSRNALLKGWSVVFANKTPLLFAFDELLHLAESNGGGMKYSATVCGGLPVINVLQRDLKTVALKKLRGVFNATTNYILQEIEKGGSMEDAIKEAQRIGAAEADPTHDTHGHDTANKLFIIMRSFTSFKGSIHDIAVTGIEHVTAEQIRAAKQRGNKIKLVASAEPQSSGWKLEVKPIEVPQHSFLATCDGWEMGIEVETDLYEYIAMKNYEADPLGTSAAVLRDAIEVCVNK
jgi:homoserine dehydrogenase